MDEEFIHTQDAWVLAPTVHPLKNSDAFSQAFNILLNYWEIKPTQYESKLHDLVLKDIRRVSAFVPWTHLETDIYHSLKKFLRAAWSTHLQVKLLIMPELGTNYPNAGFPKEILSSTANLATDRTGRVIYNYAAPNIFPLPSFSSHEVQRRFHSYLSKLGAVLAETFSETGTSDFCEVLVTNSLFNYYRNYSFNPSDHGDFAAAQVMAFRDFLNHEYTGSSKNEHSDHELFKMQLYENYNHHRFSSHVEKSLREKVESILLRKHSACSLQHVSLLNPECAPEATYQGLMTELLDFKPCVKRYYEAVIASGYRGEGIFLSNSGIFRKFTDQEKSFLALAALVHTGQVTLMAEDFSKFSPAFQRKLQTIVGFLADQKFEKQLQAVYVTASKFSMESHSFSKLISLLSSRLSIRSSLDDLIQTDESFEQRLIFMDPKSVIKLVELVSLLSFAPRGKVVAIPAPMSTVANYTTEANQYFDKFRKGRSCFKLNIGVSYTVYEYKSGHVVFYDPQLFWQLESVNKDTLLLSKFFEALVGLAESNPICRVNDPQLQMVTYISRSSPTCKLLFLMNGSDESVDTNLVFSHPVELMTLPYFKNIDQTTPITGKNFEVSVPPLGIISMQFIDRTQQVGVSWT